MFDVALVLQRFYEGLIKICSVFFQKVVLMDLAL